MYTTIHHELRKQFNLTLNEYAVIDSIYFLSRKNGVCKAGKEHIGNNLDLSRQSVINIIKKMESIGLLIRINGDVKTTELWDNSFLEEKEGVKKVYTECKESLQATVKKVYTNCKESLHNININNNINKDIIIKPVKKPTQKRKRTDIELHMFQKIFDGFTKRNGHIFLPGTEARETKAIWQMIDKAKVSQADDWEVFLLTVLQEFSKIKKRKLEKQRFIWDHPFLPSIINSAGIWPRIVDSLKISTPKIYTEEEILNYAAN